MPARLSCSTSTGPTLVKSKKLMMSKFIGVPSGATQMPSGSLGEALALEDRVTLGRVVFERVVLLQQRLAGVVELLRARVLGDRQRGGTGGPVPGEVDDLVAIDVRADRPADIFVGGRTAAGVDVQRVRPPVHVAERSLLAGPGSDLGIRGEHRRERRRLDAGDDVEGVRDHALGQVLLARIGQVHQALHLRHVSDDARAPPLVAQVEHLLIGRRVDHFPGAGRDRPILRDVPVREGRNVLALLLEDVLRHHVDADVVLVGAVFEEARRGGLELQQHGVRIDNRGCIQYLGDVSPPLDLGPQRVERVVGVGDVVCRERHAIAPHRLWAGLDGQLHVVGRVLVGLGQPHGHLVLVRAVEGQRLAHELWSGLVVGGGDKRIPELVLSELALGAATDGDQRLVARHLFEAGRLRRPRPAWATRTLRPAPRPRPWLPSQSAARCAGTVGG